MAKIPFKMSKNEQYIECHHPFKLPNGKYSGMIRIYELLNPSKVNMLTTMDWSYKPEIVDPNTTTGYNSLEIDGQFVDLQKLVQDLCKSRLRVNKLGYCYFQIMRGVADTTETYDFAFYRMNDVLKWSNYGVSMKLDKPDDAKMVWDRLDILHGNVVDAIHAKDIHQKDNNNAVNDQQNAENKKLSDRVKLLERQLDFLKVDERKMSNTVKRQDKQIGQLNAQNIERNGEIIELERKNPHEHPSRFYVAANSAAVFDIKVLPESAKTGQTIQQHWKSMRNAFSAILTPICEPVSTRESYPTFSIRVEHSSTLDTNDWYFIRVKERSKPILVYEGKKFYFNVGGLKFYIPFFHSPYISWDGPFFGPIILAGVGCRIAKDFG